MERPGVRDLLGRRSRRGRAVRFVAAIAFGSLLARLLAALAVPRELWAIPVAAVVACLLMLPRKA